MIAVEEALALVVSQMIPLPPVDAALDAALGLVLAKPVVAPASIPAFAQSSMDGYAFAAADRALLLPVIGEMAAGAKAPGRLAPGSAMRIFTGAPLPEGADTVVMQEHVRHEDNAIRLTEPTLAAGSHVRLAAAEIAQGEQALPARHRLNAASIGFLAAIGVDRVDVIPPPRVTVLVTGDELCPPGTPLTFGQVYEANSLAVAASLRSAGLEAPRVMRVGDDVALLTEALSHALNESDLVLLTGGVSVGAYDFVPAAAAACKVETLFHKIRQKPGKPLFFGMRGRVPIFGLPGNPASVLTCLHIHVLPAICAMMQQPADVWEEVTLGADYAKPAGLTFFLKGRREGNVVHPLPAQESFRLRSFAEADGLIWLAETMEHPRAGQAVRFLSTHP